MYVLNLMVLINVNLKHIRQWTLHLYAPQLDPISYNQYQNKLVIFSGS
jgi:hypothetical protein